MKKLNSFTIGKINNTVFRNFLKLMDHPSRKAGTAEIVVRNSDLTPGSTVLEIGCGSGFFTPDISKKIGHNGTLISIDIHSEAVVMTKQKVKNRLITNTSVMCINAENTGFKISFFNSVLIYGVIPSPFISTKKLLQEMHRVLKANGTISVWCGPFTLNTKSIENTGLFKLVKTQNKVHIFQKI